MQKEGVLGQQTDSESYPQELWWCNGSFVSSTVTPDWKLKFQSVLVIIVWQSDTSNPAIYIPLKSRYKWRPWYGVFRHKQASITDGKSIHPSTSAPSNQSDSNYEGTHVLHRTRQQNADNWPSDILNVLMFGVCTILRDDNQGSRASEISFRSKTAFSNSTWINT